MPVLATSSSHQCDRRVGNYPLVLTIMSEHTDECLEYVTEKGKGQRKVGIIGNAFSVCLRRFVEIELLGWLEMCLVDNRIKLDL